MGLFNLAALNTNPHHPAPPYRVELRDTYLHPRRFKIGEQDLRDVLSQRFEQTKMSAGESALDVAHDVGIIERIHNVVGLAGATVGQCNFQVYLQGLWNTLFPFVHAD